MNKIIFAFRFAIPVLLLAVWAQPVMAETGSLEKSVTTRVESTIERTAIIALRRIAETRSDIHRKQWAAASRDLNEASRLMDSIRDNLSTATPKNLLRIAREHLGYEGAKEVLGELPPIYASLRDISVYLPTDKAIMHLDKARGDLEKDRKQDAARELDLANSSLIVIEVDLPLLKTEKYIDQARQYLAAHNGAKADGALKLAEKRAMTLYTGINSPLFQAKQNLWLAFRNYSTASSEVTRQYLRQAREHLGRASATGSAKQKEEAGKLTREVEALEQKLAGEGKVAESSLTAVWEKSKALVERSAAYLSAGLSEEETTLKGQNNLIEAKLHVSYAEIYQVTTMETGKAIAELDKADSYLKKAGTSDMAGPKDRKQLLEMEKMIATLKADVATSDAGVQARYESLKNTLDKLIQKI